MAGGLRREQGWVEVAGIELSRTHRNPSDPIGCEHKPSGSVGIDRIRSGPTVDTVNKESIR